MTKRKKLLLKNYKMARFLQRYRELRREFMRWWVIDVRYAFRYSSDEREEVFANWPIKDEERVQQDRDS